MMRILACLSTLLLFMLVGCGDQSAEKDAEKKTADETATTEEAAAGEQATNSSPANLEFAMIQAGANSSLKADMTTIYKLDTTESWQQFWNEHTKNLQPAETAPVIDFTKNMLIAIVDTDQPSSGYELLVEKLENVDNKLYVYVTRKQPGAGCVNLGMISQPFAIIEVPKSELIPELRLTTQTVACE